MGLRGTFSTILQNYGTASSEGFSGHAIAALIRGAARNEIASIAGENYVVKGSAGQSDWAVTPWLAIMDPFVTDSTQRGFYLVYLFNSDDQTVYLSLNQGVTAVKEEFGGEQAQRDILEARASILLKRLGAHNEMPKREITLSEATQLSKSYQWGHVTGFEYQLSALPGDDTLVADLKHALRAYQALVEKNGYVLEEESGAHSIVVEERRRLRMHERLERIAADPKKVKRLKGFDCEVCGFNFEAVYGDLGREFIEAHHLIPIGDLQAGMSRQVDLEKDFAVLCANCHRMAHRLEDPSDIETLRKLLSE